MSRDGGSQAIALSCRTQTDTKPCTLLRRLLQPKLGRNLSKQDLISERDHTLIDVDLNQEPMWRKHGV